MGTILLLLTLLGVGVPTCPRPDPGASCTQDFEASREPELALAAQAFAEAEAASARDAGALWGQSLAGPMIFLDLRAGRILANRADPDGTLVEQGGVFVGPMTSDLSVANTAQLWQGQMWSTVIWPLPNQEEPRLRLLMHESLHRIQPDLGSCAFPASPNAHLDTGTGRIWLRMEWRALAAALRAGDEPARSTALLDALAFRAARHGIFPDAHDSEVALESNEGVAEYTGYRLSVASEEQRVERVAQRLLDDERADRHARGFAYASGPAYGVLLDLADGASWRAGFAGTVDFGASLADAWQLTLPEDALTFAKTRLESYDGQTVLLDESNRERARRERLVRYESDFVAGPILELTASQAVQYSFNPYGEESLPGYGQVYDSLTVTDTWGTLKVETGGALLLRDEVGTVAGFRVPRPQVEPENSRAALVGEGWSLELANGWQAQAGPRPGDMQLVEP